MVTMSETELKTLEDMKTWFPSFVNQVQFAKYLTEQNNKNPHSVADVKESMEKVFSFLVGLPMDKSYLVNQNLKELNDELNELIEVNKALRDEYWEHVETLQSVEKVRNEVLSEYREAIQSFNDVINNEDESQQNGRDTFYNMFDELVREVVRDSGAIDADHDTAPEAPTEERSNFEQWFDNENNNINEDNFGDSNTGGNPEFLFFNRTIDSEERMYPTIGTEEERVERTLDLPDMPEVSISVNLFNEETIRIETPPTETPSTEDNRVEEEQKQEEKQEEKIEQKEEDAPKPITTPVESPSRSRASKTRATEPAKRRSTRTRKTK